MIYAVKHLTMIRSYLPDRTVSILTGESLSRDYSVLERPWLNNMRNESCIAPGRYLVTRNTTGRYRFYGVGDVTGRSDIEMHNGTYPTNSDGCLLIGRAFDNEYNLIDSSLACSSFLAEMGNESFVLDIRAYCPFVDKDLWRGY